MSGRQLNLLKNLPCAVCTAKNAVCRTAPRGNIGAESFDPPSIGDPHMVGVTRYAWACSPYRGRAMPDEPIIREKTREAIQSGRLPITQPRRIFCLRSAGATCAVCGDPVPVGEMEFELEFRTAPPPDEKPLIERLNWTPEVRHCHLHPHCFMAWQFERTNVGPPERHESI